MGDYELYHAKTRKHKYIKKIGNRYFYTQEELRTYLQGKKNDVTFEKTKDGYGNTDYRIDFHKHRDSKGNVDWSDGVGIRTGNKSIELYNTTNKAYEKNPDIKGDNKGRFRREYAEDGSRYSLDYSDKKTYRKKQRKEVEQKKNWSNYLKERGLDNKNAEADYRSSKAELERAEKKDAKRAARNKRIRKAASSTLSRLKKQTKKGKKALENYQKKRAPKVTVIQSISEDKNYKRQNGN